MLARMEATEEAMASVKVVALTVVMVMSAGAEEATVLAATESVAAWAPLKVVVMQARRLMVQK